MTIMDADLNGSLPSATFGINMLMNSYSVFFASFSRLDSSSKAEQSALCALNRLKGGSLIIRSPFMFLTRDRAKYYNERAHWTVQY